MKNHISQLTVDEVVNNIAKVHILFFLKMILFSIKYLYVIAVLYRPYYLLVFFDFFLMIINCEIALNSLVPVAFGSHVWFTFPSLSHIIRLYFYQC